MQYIEYSSLHPEQFHDLVPRQKQNNTILLVIGLVGLAGFLGYLYFEKSKENQRLMSMLPALKQKESIED